MATSTLSSPESQLLSAAATGTPVDLRVLDPEQDEPANGGNWDTSRQIRAEFLVDLLLGTLGPGHGHPRAIKLRGARITGLLDLEDATLICPLLLRDCHIDEWVNLEGASAPAIHMPGCRLTNLAASQLRTRGDLELNAGFIASDGVYLLGAHIGGQLDFTGATLTNPHGAALSADGIVVDLDMFCRDRFTVTGEVRLPGARIGGQLDFTGATLTAATSRSDPKGRRALAADGINVANNMVCGFTATGEVRLPDAHIGGQLDFTGATLTATAAKANPEETAALAADGITVDHNMLCGFTVTGEVRLIHAHIRGQLDFTGATLTNPHGAALSADGITVDQDLLGRREFIVTGEARLPGARIGGQLDFTGATLTAASSKSDSKKTWALAADGINVANDMVCGFTVTGEVRLPGARVGGDLDFTGATLTNVNGTALDLRGVSASALRLTPQSAPDGVVDLTNASVGTFIDDPASWPAVFQLRGFAYSTLDNREVSTRARLRWLRRHPGRFTPQTYDQLAETYRRAGEDGAARKVAVAKQWHRRRPYNPLSWLWYFSVGYGYRTWQALVWLVALAVAGSVVFTRAYPVHMVAVTAHPPRFQPVVYTLDVLLPVVGLGQKAGWQPATPGLLDWYWGLTAAGWVLATAVVAGLTGVLKRD